VTVDCEAGLRAKLGLSAINAFTVRSEAVAFHAEYALSNSAFDFPEALVCPGSVAEQNPQHAAHMPGARHFGAGQLNARKSMAGSIS